MILKKPRKIRIFYKFLIVLLTISAIPIFIVGMRLIDINRVSLQDLTLELQINQATRISDAVESHMDKLRDMIVFVIDTHGRPPLDWTLIERLLRSMLASSEDLLTVSLVTEDGREITKVYAPELEGKVALENRSSHEGFIKARRTGEFAVSELYYQYGIPSLDVVYPFAENMFIFIETDLSGLLKLVERTRIGQTGFAYVVDSKGRIILHPEVEKGMDKTSVSDRPIVEAVLSGRLLGSIEFEDTETGEKIVGAYAPVATFAGLGWGAIVEQNQAEAYYSARVMQRNALYLLVAVVIAACIIGYFLAQSLTSPIIRLTGVAREIAVGNFNSEPIRQWLQNVKLKDEVVELASTFTVMTQQLKRYTEMQADKMNAILFSIADGIIMTDYSGSIMLSNKRAGQLLGIDESLEGKKIQDIIKREEIYESLREAREKKEHIVKELDLSNENVSKHLMAETSIVSQAESRQDLGTVTVIRDITLEKELEQMKDDFIHSITHDLRSPMTSIRGFLEFLMDGSAGEINEQQKEFLEIIDRSSKRLLVMISDILDVAKMESGSMHLEREPTNIRSDIIDSAVNTMSMQAKRDKVELKAIQKNEILEINVDKNLIDRVLTNLLSNALKFTPEGGEVRIEIEDKGDRIHVAVEDTGSGMPKEMCERIFDKFEQVKGSKGKRKGTGLGLTITKYIVEAHGGKIWAESQPGQGSRFEFWIPRRESGESSSDDKKATD